MSCSIACCRRWFSALIGRKSPGAADRKEEPGSERRVVERAEDEGRVAHAPELLAQRLARESARGRRRERRLGARGDRLAIRGEDCL
jgi:hypothetical protein